jgi:hypothetical protein
LLLALPVLSARAQETARPAGCAPVASDSARFGSEPTFAACEVDRAARLLRTARVSAPHFPSGVDCLVAEFEFVVDARGTPVLATARLLAASTPEFGVAARSSLPRWRYAPALRGGQPVRQLVVGRLALRDDRRPFDDRVPFVDGRSSERPPPSPPGSTSPCR